MRFHCAFVGLHGASSVVLPRWFYGLTWRFHIISIVLSWTFPWCFHNHIPWCFHVLMMLPWISIVPPRCSHGLPWRFQVVPCFNLLPWCFHGAPIVLSWRFHGISWTRMAYPWRFHGYFHGLPWRFHVRSWTSMMPLRFFRVALMDCHGASIFLPWCFHGLRWSFYGLNWLPWCFHGTSMDFICFHGDCMVLSLIPMGP